MTAVGQRRRGGSLGATVRWRLRAATGAFHVLPHFLIIGAAKAGSTSLLRFLAAQPDVRVPAVEEVHFFDTRFHLGPWWYRSHFPRRWERSTISGESSPYYLFHPLVPQRARKGVPGVKLIVLVRDPVERAYSDWSHRVRKGEEDLSFEDALAREAEVLPAETERLLRDDGYRSSVHQTCSYAARGMYLEQLLRWEQAFDRRQLLVVRSEDLFEATAAPALAEVLRFLDLPVPEPERLAFPATNLGARRAPMADATRTALEARFRAPNRALAGHLGRPSLWPY